MFEGGYIIRADFGRNDSHGCFGKMICDWTPEVHVRSFGKNPQVQVPVTGIWGGIT